jgi:hypothetical protein
MQNQCINSDISKKNKSEYNLEIIKKKCKTQVQHRRTTKFAPNLADSVPNSVRKEIYRYLSELITEPASAIFLLFDVFASGVF